MANNWFALAKRKRVMWVMIFATLAIVLFSLLVMLNVSINDFFIDVLAYGYVLGMITVICFEIKHRSPNIIKNSVAWVGAIAMFTLGMHVFKDMLLFQTEVMSLYSEIRGAHLGDTTIQSASYSIEQLNGLPIKSVLFCVYVCAAVNIFMTFVILKNVFFKIKPGDDVDVARSGL